MANLKILIKMRAANQHFVIVPGNGCDDVEDCNWYAWVRDELVRRLGCSVGLQSMPDPFDAKEEEWIPFILNELKCNDKTIVIGHSSGAEAAMRLAEKHRVGGVVLVSPCYTDMGLESERISGYYSRPWLWDDIKKNAGFIVQFSSPSDPLVPYEAEQMYVHRHLQSELKVLQRRGHFCDDKFPELVDWLVQHVNKTT